MPVAAACGPEPCPLCGEGTSYRFRKQEADYRRCNACGFQFARGATNPNLDSTLASLETAYLRYLEPDPSDAINFEECWRWMTSFGANAGARVLDVGAGSGKFVRFLRLRGVDAHGVEPSAELFRRFLAGDECFTQGDAGSRRPGSDGAYDVVTAFDVLEHVADPAAFLRDVSAALKAGGLLFITTPDASSAAARVLGRWWHFYNRYHLSYFSTAVLQRAAAPHGFELLESRRRGRMRSVAYIVQYLSDFVGVVPGNVARHFENRYVRVNMHDTMHLVFRKSGPTQP